jgi:hypothetical protein
MALREKNIIRTFCGPRQGTLCAILCRGPQTVSARFNVDSKRPRRA